VRQRHDRPDDLSVGRAPPAADTNGAFDPCCNLARTKTTSEKLVARKIDAARQCLQQKRFLNDRNRDVRDAQLVFAHCVHAQCNELLVKLYQLDSANLAYYDASPHRVNAQR
jgi:hypothetical protein